MGLGHQLGETTDRDCHARGCMTYGKEGPARSVARRTKKFVRRRDRGRGVLVEPDKKMPRPRWPRRRTGMILGLAERIGVFPGSVIPVPGANSAGPTRLPIDLRPSHAKLI